LRLAQVEDLFEKYPMMMVDLVKELLKKGMAANDDFILTQAKGIWLRHKLDRTAPI